MLRLYAEHLVPNHSSNYQSWQLRMSVSAGTAVASTPAASAATTRTTASASAVGTATTARTIAAVGTVRTILLPAAGAYCLAIGFLTVEVRLRFILIEIAAALQGNCF